MYTALPQTKGMIAVKVLLDISSLEGGALRHVDRAVPKHEHQLVHLSLGWDTRLVIGFRV